MCKLFSTSTDETFNPFHPQMSHISRIMRFILMSYYYYTYYWADRAIFRFVLPLLWLNKYRNTWRCMNWLRFSDLCYGSWDKYFLSTWRKLLVNYFHHGLTVIMWLTWSYNKSLCWHDNRILLVPARLLHTIIISDAYIVTR